MSAYRLNEGDWLHRFRERNAQMRADRPKMTIAALAAKYRVSYHTAYEIVRDVDGPRAPPLKRKRLQADRNAKIAADYFNGVPIRKLAQQYALTFQRVHQIVQHESVRLGRTARDRRREFRERNAQMRADRLKMTIAALAAKYRLGYNRAYQIVRDVDGPSLGPRRRLEADRNAKIAAAYFNGVPIRELAQQYALTVQRIHQIVQHESARLGRKAPDRRRDWRKRNAQMRADRPKMTIAALAAKYRLSYKRAYEIVRDVDGPRASSLGARRRLQADRNAKIAADYFNGVPIRKLAQQYALSFPRIRQIVQRERLGRRAPARRRRRSR